MTIAIELTRQQVKFLRERLVEFLTGEDIEGEFIAFPNDHDDKMAQDLIRLIDDLREF